MPKQAVKKMNGVLASVFAHTGHISREDAKEISGLEDHEFEQVYARASVIAEDVLKAEGNKMDKFIEHVAKVIDKYTKEFGDQSFF